MVTSTYGTETTSMSPAVLIFYLVVLAVELVAMWKIYTKAGQPGWAAIVPIYNIIILLKIVKMDWWHILIMLIPCASMVYGCILSYKLATAFGKDTGFAVLTIFFSPIMLPIIAFGSAEYVG